MRPEEIAGAYEWETGNVIVETFGNRDPLEFPGQLLHPLDLDADHREPLRQVFRSPIKFNVLLEPIQRDFHSLPLITSRPS